MKKTYTLTAVLLAALLTGCGNTSAMDSLIEAQEAETLAAITEATVPPPPTDPSVELPDSSSGEYDVDLTVLDSTMVYAQCYDMVYNPDNYEDKTVRVRGPFAYFLDPDTNREYFAVLISDATACCSQGIEFRLKGEHTYPDDYPEIGATITVVGKFNSYEENGSPYVQLLDAEITE